jgi:glycerophosphoryl diester phosphodiesterase
VAGAVISAVAATGWSDRVVVSSFSTAVLDAAVARARADDCEVAVGWLVPPGLDPHAGATEAAVARGYRCVHPFVSWVDETLVRAARRAGLRLHVWTVNAPADIGAMVALGVDAVITDRPEEALVIAAAG